MIPVADMRPLATEAGSAVQAGGSRPGAARPAPARRCGPRKAGRAGYRTLGRRRLNTTGAGEAAPARRHDSAFLRKRLVKSRTKRFRGNVTDVSTAAMASSKDALSAA